MAPCRLLVPGITMARIEIDHNSRRIIPFNAMGALVGLLLVLAGPAFAAEGDWLSKDEVGLLYSSHIQFGADGFPTVTIGIMEGQDRVEVSSTEGLKLVFRTEVEEQWVTKTLESAPGQPVSLIVRRAIPARVTYWCGVKSIPFSDREMLLEESRKWRKRVKNVQVFETGSVFGISGHVIDNRTYVLTTRAFESRNEAKQEADELFQKYGVKAFVHPHLSRRPSGTMAVLDSRGRRVAEAIDLVKLRGSNEGAVTVNRVEHGGGFRDRTYTGTILVTLDRGGKLVVVNRIGVERLLEGLVPAEIHAGVPLEALKAQAVVARGEVFAKLGSRHFLDPYLLCAETHCQVYSGIGTEKERASWAVRATQGELLFLGSNLVDSVYSASCGGHTEDNDNVWSDPPSEALRGRFDMAGDQADKWSPLLDHLRDWLTASPPAFCKISSLSRKGLYRWKKSISSEVMDQLVAREKDIGRVVSVQVLSRGVSGRVKVVRVVGSKGELLVRRELPVRRLFGNLKSGMFLVNVKTDEEQMPGTFEFIGGGWGHGVGMCQIGAVGMAEHGYDYRQILAHYYGGAKVFRLYGSKHTQPEPRDIKEEAVDSESE